GDITRPDSSGLNHKYVDHHQGKGHIQLRAFKGTRMFFHWDTPGYPGDRWTLWAALKRQFGDPFDISFKALNGKDPVSWTLDLPLSLVMDWLAYLHDDPLDQTASFLARPGIKVLKPDGEERNPGEDDPDFGVDYGSLVSIGLGLGFDWDQRKHWQEVIHRKNQDAVKWFRTDINHTHPITVYPGDTVTVGFGANLNALVKVLNDYDIHRSKALLFWPPPKGKERKVLLW
ncbi:MAG: hypothetical protein KGZ25_12665, partial [Planctomycetes bacterium]|nr:hypothetical protein [Planctomycetota bacterium]